MSDRKRFRRRGILRLIGAGSAAGVGTALAGAVPASASTRSMVLLSPLVRESGRPESTPAVSSRSSIRGKLVDENGAAVGSFDGMRLVVESGQTIDITFLEQHSFRLADGTLFGSGISVRTPTVTDQFAVTGGTGSFAGVSGTYRIRQSERHLGGTRFEFALARGS